MTERQQKSSDPIAGFEALWPEVVRRLRGRQRFSILEGGYVDHYSVDADTGRQFGAVLTGIASLAGDRREQLMEALSLFPTTGRVMNREEAEELLGLLGKVHVLVLGLKLDGAGEGGESTRELPPDKGPGEDHGADVAEPQGGTWLSATRCIEEIPDAKDATDVRRFCQQNNVTTRRRGKRRRDVHLESLRAAVKAIEKAGERQLDEIAERKDAARERKRAVEQERPAE